MIYFLNLSRIPNGGCLIKTLPLSLSTSSCEKGKETLLVLKERMTLYISLRDHYVQIDGLSWTFYVKHSM